MKPFLVFSLITKMSILLFDPSVVEEGNSVTTAHCSCFKASAIILTILLCRSFRKRSQWLRIPRTCGNVSISLHNWLRKRFVSGMSTYNTKIIQIQSASRFCNWLLWFQRFVFRSLKWVVQEICVISCHVHRCGLVETI